MINQETYPKQDVRIQLGIRRIPLHYLSKEQGGNGVLQHNIIFLCEMQRIYNIYRKDWELEQTSNYKERFDNYKSYLTERETKTYNEFCKLVKKETEYKDSLQENLTNWYNKLIEFIKEIKID